MNNLEQFIKDHTSLMLFASFLFVTLPNALNISKKLCATVWNKIVLIRISTREKFFNSKFYKHLWDAEINTIALFLNNDIHREICKCDAEAKKQNRNDLTWKELHKREIPRVFTRGLSGNKRRCGQRGFTPSEAIDEVLIDAKRRLGLIT